MSEAVGRVGPPSDGRLPVRPPFPARPRASHLAKVGGARLRAGLGGRGGSDRADRSHVGRLPGGDAPPATDRGTGPPRRTAPPAEAPGRSCRLRPPWG